jgi:putative transposase
VADLDRRLAVLGLHVHEGVPLSHAAADAGVPVRTARRWLTAYEADGADGLARISRTDRGSHRVSAELRALIEGLALRRPPPRMAEVHRAVVKVAEEKDWPVLSY